MADLQQISDNWGSLRTDQKRKVMSTLTPEDREQLMQLRQAGSPSPSTDTANQPLQSLGTPGQALTIGRGPTEEERKRTEMIEAPRAVLGTGGAVAGYKAAGVPGEMLGSYAGEMTGGAMTEGLKKVENPYLRGFLTAGPYGMFIEHQAEKAEERVAAQSPEGSEPEIGRFDPANSALSGEGFVDTMGEVSEEAMMNSGLGAVIGGIGSRLVRDKSTPIKEIAERTGLADDVPAFEQTESGLAAIFGKSWPMLTSPGRRQFGQQLKGLADKISTRLQEVAEKLGKQAPNTEEGNLMIGRAIQENLQAADDAVRVPLSRQYDDFFSGIEPMLVQRTRQVQRPTNILDAKGMPAMATEEVTEEVAEGGLWANTADLKKLIKQNWETPGGMTMPKTDEGQRLLDWVESVPDRVPVADLSKARSMILELARKSGPTRSMAIEYDLAKGIDDQIMDAFKTNGMDDAYAVMKDLNSEWLTYIETQRNHHIKALTAARRPELLAKALFRQGSAGSPGNITLTSAAFDALEAAPGSAELKGQIARSALEQTLDYGRRNHSMETTLSKWWRNLEPRQKSYLAQDPEHVKELNDLVELIDEVKPTQTAHNYLGGNQNLQEIVQVGGLTAGVGGVLGGAAGGIIGQDAESGGVGAGAGAFGTALFGLFTPKYVASAATSKIGTRLLRGAMTDYYRAAQSSVGLRAVDIVMLGARIEQAAKRSEQIQDRGRINRVPEMSEIDRNAGGAL